ncbi:peptidylprolyl isomerase [Bacillus wiedmannii]|uniref:peptidylprolyl isomerase n=1 Tax=Bacillus wiedmannii TaxID=1890302 RepID=UPI002E1CD057|nr:peptidylprolyl isomerase [Bacillus wiedmannii]
MKVTENELKALYDTKKPKLHISHILLTDETQAKAIKAKLDAGEDFNKLAMEYSQDSATKNVGGDMGILQFGSMIPAFEDKAYELQVGQISEPIQTNYVFHIIKILDKQKLPSFKEMKPQLTAELIEQNMDQQKLQNQIEKLVDKSDLKINEETLKDMYKKKEVIEKSSPK